MKLSVLIPSLEKRSKSLTELVFELINQSSGTERVFADFRKEFSIEKHICNEVEIIVCVDKGEMSIGAKRNLLLNEAIGDYICYVDDDDKLASCYIEEVLKGIKTNPDCCSLTGIITTNGKDEKIFKHFIECDEYCEKDGIYLRYPNHLNTIKSGIAKQFKFPEINHGEDTDWATQIHKSGLLKKEYKIEPIIYYYKYITQKTYA